MKIFSVYWKNLHKMKAVLLIWRSIGSKMYLFPQFWFFCKKDV